MGEQISGTATSQQEMDDAINKAAEAAKRVGKLDQGPVGLYGEKTVIKGNNFREAVDEGAPYTRSRVSLKETPGEPESNINAGVTRSRPQGATGVNTMTMRADMKPGETPEVSYEKVKRLSNGEYKVLTRESKGADVARKAIKFAAEQTAAANTALAESQETEKIAQ